MKFILQYTSWEEIPVEVQAFFNQWMGNDPQRAQNFFELYFHWFTIPHEVCHALRVYYSSSGSSCWGEEIACNSFAVAYWKARGETKRLLHLRQFMRGASSRLEDPAPKGESRSNYFDAHYSELALNPPAYGYYQFSMVLTALEEQMDFAEVLRVFITPQANEATPPPAAPYPAISSELSLQIVSDMRNYLACYGVYIPEIRIVRSYSPGIEFVRLDDE